MRNEIVHIQLAMYIYIYYFALATAVAGTLILFLCYQPSSGTGSGSISFASSHITVKEDGSTDLISVDIPFVRDGGTSQDVVATWQVVIYVFRR